MVRIPTVTEQSVQTEVVQGPRASANVDPAAFGNPLVEAAVTGVQTFAEIDERAAIAEAEQMDLQLNKNYRELLHGQDGYFNSSNKVAFDQAPEVQNQMEKMRKEMMETIKNPAAREAFGKVSQNRINQSAQSIMNHATRNLKAWEQSNTQAQVEDSLENASIYFTDSKALATQMALGEAAIHDLADSTDMGAQERQEKLETYRSSFNSTAIEGAINNGDIDKAESMLAAKRDTLEGPTAALLESKIAKQKGVIATQKEASNVNAIATAAVETYGDADNARQLIIEEINKLSPGEERSKALKEADQMLNRKMKADKEALGARFEDAEKTIASGVTLNQWLTDNGDAWKDMTTEQQDALRSGAVASTDQVMWSEFQLMSDQQLANVTPAEHFHKLKPADRQKLTDMVKNAREGKTNSLARTRTKFTKDMVTQAFGAEKDWNDDERVTVNNFYDAVDAQVEALRESGKVVSDSDYKEIVKGLTRTVVQEGIFFDSNIDATDVFDNDTMPQEERDMIIEYLLKNDIPLTTGNIIKAHKRATQ